MNYGKIRRYDTANGKGVRTTLFVSGCTHKCKGCFNEDAQSFNYGDKWTKEKEDLFMSYVKDEKVVGVNILGGEPLQQTMDSNLLSLIYRIRKETDKDIWMWTGYTWEQIMDANMSMETNIHRKLLVENVDVLIDGRFIENMKDLSLKYRGSRNQRIIDVKKSLKENKVVLYR